MRCELFLTPDSYKDGATDDAHGLLLGGDVMLGRGVAKQIEVSSPGFPFQKALAQLPPYRIAFCNLESTIAESGTPSSNARTHLRASPGIEKRLAMAQIGVVSLANNHILDYGDGAARETVNHLTAFGIHTVGAGLSHIKARSPVLFDMAGIQVGFLAYSTLRNTTQAQRHRSFVAAPANLRWMQEDIAALANRAHLCVVSLHWGYEGISYPPPESRRLGKMLVDAGANIVLGHHPHVLQGIEMYQGGVIAYSLGDWVFDSLEPQRREALLLHVHLDSHCSCRIHPIPVWRNELLEPTIARGDKANQILKKLTRLSAALSDGTSDQLFWKSAGSVFLSDQRIGWRDALRRSGIRAVVQRVRRVRWRHLRLFLAALQHRTHRKGG